MKIIDTGVLGTSFMDFSIPSDFAKSALYYCPQFGHYYCTEGYNIVREHLDLFLLVYMCGGTLHLEAEGRRDTAAKGEIVLLDCRRPHRYYCSDRAEFLWLHFYGNASAPYTRYLIEQSGIVFSGERIPALRQSFETVIAAAQSTPTDEHPISLNLHRILSKLAAPEEHAVAMSALLYPAIHHIDEHFAEPIELGELSALCRLSTSHFIRCFRKYAGCTPHEYLLSYRLKQAKQLLVAQPLSIEQIAELCGFNSVSHFARAFRKSNGMTPSEFRRVQF